MIIYHFFIKRLTSFPIITGMNLILQHECMGKRPKAHLLENEYILFCLSGLV